MRPGRHRHHLRLAIEPLIWDLIPQVERGWRYEEQGVPILCRLEVRFLSIRATWWTEWIGEPQQESEDE